MGLNVMKLTTLYDDCCLRQKNKPLPEDFKGITDDYPDKVCTVDGVVFVRNVFDENCFFDLDVLEAKKSEIEAMLLELPIEFMRTYNENGSAFLRAFVDKDGYKWTDYLHNVDWLLSLGRAIGRVEWTEPQDEWAKMHDVWPCFVVLDDLIKK